MFYAGFDTSMFPGMATMQWLRYNTNLVWCGFYLGPAPSHRDSSWMNRRETLIEQGWGFAPIYVGQQTVGPGSHGTDTGQGRVDSADAVRLAISAGFPQGTVIFLDIENGLPLTAPEAGYVGAWVKGVTGGGYTPGVYVSHAMADAVRTVAPAARIWAFNVPTIAPSDFHGTTFPAPSPSDSGFAEAVAWQRAQSVNIQASNRTLRVDLDTAATADPSRP